VSLFGAIGIGASGLDAMQTWIDTTAGNIANANDQVPAGQPTYAEQTPIFAPDPSVSGGSGNGGSGEGVTVSGIALGSSAGQLKYEPGGPVAAGTGGMVAVPTVDVATELTHLVEAQTGYQADAAAIERAKTAYQSALTLGS
jgi:flagellar basal-body rod protein FlgC